MPTSGIRVLTIGKKFALPYDVRHIDDVSGLLGSLATFRPDVIVTSTFIPGVLNNFAFEWRKRWIHVTPDSNDADVAAKVEGCHSFNLWGQAENEKHNPLVSVYTGTKNTGDYLRETYQSLRDQGYTNWEWVVVDDASEDSTWKRLASAAKEDPRVRPFRSAIPMGKIGAVKDQATRLCRGQYLVELDHDDMLVDSALSEIVTAFRDNPDVGFVYSNASNFFENGTFHRFQDEFWKNRYRETEYRGRKWIECINPDIYDRFGPNYWDQFGYFLTVGPNHVRAFRASTFRELGGYNPNLPVADDWDLYARFFLNSKCLHLDKMLYLYRFKDNWGNTTFTRNKAIQDHLALGRAHRAAEFEAFNKKRLTATAPPEAPKGGGVDDPCFVISTRRDEDVKAILERLPGQDVFAIPGADSILDAYEAGRLRWRGRRRIIYVHDDVEFRDLEGFLKAVRELPAGTHGVCGSAAPDSLAHGPWWEMHPLAGKYIQAFSDKSEKTVEWPGAEKAQEVTWLDGLCLVTVDQGWDWNVRGNPNIWHGYDWLACKRTLDAGSKCFTIAQPGAPMLAHRGYGRVEGYEETLKALRKAVAPATSDDVSFIVLDATGSSMAVRCLNSIRKHAPGAEVILVANGAQPSSEAAALADKVIALETNIGFAAGANRGAMEASRPLVCFMNDDAAFVNLTPEIMARSVTQSHPIVGCFSNRAKPPQGDLALENVPSIDVLVDMVVGLCMMMPVEVFHELGGFDTRLLTWEDDDFCLRAARHGWGSKVVGGAWVDHERHSTFKALGMDPNAVIAENRQKYQTLHPKIRVVVISKDESGAIEGFFRQFEGVTRDWCLLDTGSTDNTKEIARAIGVRIEDGPFEDFSQARNLALERFSDGADWIIMLDPDERLDAHTIEHLEALLSKSPYDILLAPLDAVGQDGSRRSFVPKPFAFRASPKIRWTFKVHEKLIGSLKQALVKNGMIEHVLALHDAPRRGKSEGLYRGLMEKEPYFTNETHRKNMRQSWPILDYDRIDDPRIAKVHCGPLVSVVIATYNRKDLLKKAIDSALTQDYLNLEVIVVGDACPSLKIKNRAVRWVNLPKNHGAGGAVPRNYGIMLSSGALIAYLDDDNEWTPGHVSSLYAALRSTESSYAFSSMQTLGKGLIFREPKRGSIDTSCVLHKKELIRKHGWWKDRIEAGYAHDWEFFSRWGAEKWVATEQPTLIYNAETSGQLEFLKNMIATSST